MSRPVPLLLLLLLAGLCGWAATGSHSAFTASTQSAGNGLQTGTVTLTDDDQGGAVYALSGLEPADAYERCVKVTYTGSLPADVALHAEGMAGTGAGHLRLRIDAGRRTGGATTPSCTGFTADAQLFTGSFATFASTYASGSGLAAVPFGKTRWETGDEVAYRVRVWLPATADASAQGTGVDAHTLVWRSANR